jgi:hypothetical protein
MDQSHSVSRGVVGKGDGMALSQNCLFEAKSENRVLENQGLASPNFPVFGNLRQSRRPGLLSWRAYTLASSV